MVTNRRRSSLKLLAKFPERLAHIRISHVHFSKEVVRQSAVVIETTEVCAAHVADLQLLVTRGAGGVLEVLQFSLAGFLLVFGGAGLVELVVGLSDRASLTEDGDFEKAGVDCFGEVRDLFELWELISSSKAQPQEQRSCRGRK